MTQRISPYIEGKYGWDFGESGWNLGMDDNLLKFSFLFDRNIDAIVDTLPTAVNGKAYYLTTDRRLYFAVDNTYYSTPIPKWFILSDRVSGTTWQFNGVDLEQVPNSATVGENLTSLNTFTNSLDYNSQGEYIGGLVLSERNDYVSVSAGISGAPDNALYKPAAGTTLPLTLTGTWATDSANLVLLGDDVLRQELGNSTDPDSGAALVGRATVSVASVFALLAARRDPSQTLLVASYHGGWDAEVRSPVGGGAFVWDAARAKSAHNGGTIISPTVPWDGDRATLDNFLGGVGETEPSGSGCWVRVRDSEGISIEWFGAIGDDTFDNSVVVQSALDAESTSEVIVPLGSYLYTVSPVIPEGVSIRGLGLGSVLRPTGCHGLTFTNNNTVGARFVRDLHIYGQGVGSPYDGIVFDSGTDQIKRTTGVVLSGLYIAWCRTGIDAKGLWHSKLDHVVINSCIDGVILRGHCVSIDFASCKIQAGAAVVAQDRYGIRVLSDANYSPATSRRPEAIKIHSETLVFGFQYNIDVETCLNFGLFGSDIDYGIKLGVRIGTVDGGLSIRDNWIAGDGDAGQLYYGIELSNVATDSGHRNTIVGNNLTMTGTPVAGCRAIQVGSLHGNAAIRDNTVYGGFEVGVYLELNSSRCTLEGNTLVAPYPVVVASSGHRIATNLFDGDLFFPSAGTRNDWGHNEGATTRELIEVTLPSGATSAAVTFASLGLKNIVANQRVFARAAQEGATSQGTISAEVSTTGVTVRTSTAVGVDTSLLVEVITV